MKPDDLMWTVAVLLIGVAVTQGARSALRRPGVAAGLGLLRQNLGLILLGALVGIAADLPSNFYLAPSGGIGWWIAIFCAIVSVPIHFVVDLTHQLWLYWGAAGHWVVVVLTALVYHGALAVWLGNVYRREPRRALMIGAALFGVHLGVYFVWQTLTIAQAAS